MNNMGLLDKADKFGMIKINVVAAGVPARIICTIEDYYEKNKDKVDETYSMPKKEKFEYLYKKFNIKRGCY